MDQEKDEDPNRLCDAENGVSSSDIFTSEDCFKTPTLKEDKEINEFKQENYKHMMVAMERMKMSLMKELVESQHCTKQEKNKDEEEAGKSNDDIYNMLAEVRESTKLLVPIKQDIEECKNLNQQNLLNFTEELKQTNESLLKEFKETLQGTCVDIIDNLKNLNDTKEKEKEDSKTQQEDKNYEVVKHLLNEIINVQESLTNVCQDINNTMLNRLGDGTQTPAASNNDGCCKNCKSLKSKSRDIKTPSRTIHHRTQDMNNNANNANKKAKEDTPQWSRTNKKPKEDVTSGESRRKRLSSARSVHPTPAASRQHWEGNLRSSLRAPAEKTWKY